MAGIEEIAGKQVGPLPVGVWVAVGVGGVGFAWWYNKHKKPATVNAQGDTTVSDTGSGDYSTVGSSAGQNNSANPTPTSTPQDNDQWYSLGVTYLVSRGLDPGISDNALRKYLAGTVLTVQEQGMVNLVILKFGPPPTAVQPVGTVPPVQPPPGGHGGGGGGGGGLGEGSSSSGGQRRKPKSVRYRVKKGDTLQSIAQHYYGNRTKWVKIYNANRKLIKNPNRIEPGWTLTIPNPTRGV